VLDCLFEKEHEHNEREEATAATASDGRKCRSRYASSLNILSERSKVDSFHREVTVDNIEEIGGKIKRF
jgi:hypothetical protein